jgi:hypothetical protein
MADSTDGFSCLRMQPPPSNYSEFCKAIIADLEETVEPDLSDIRQSDQQYVVGLDSKGEYVSKDTKTGKLLDSSALLKEKGRSPFDGMVWWEGIDQYTTFTNDGSENFQKYEGQFVNGKREGRGKYTALNINKGHFTLTFDGNFKNNLPVEGTLKINIWNVEPGGVGDGWGDGEDGYSWKIKGFFVNGLPDETKNCEVIYSRFVLWDLDRDTMLSPRAQLNYKLWSNLVYRTKMIGKISFEKIPQYTTKLLDNNKPDKLLEFYIKNMNYFFNLDGRSHQIYPPYQPTKVGVFNSSGLHKTKASLGGQFSKKRSNHKTKQSHKSKIIRY